MSEGKFILESEYTPGTFKSRDVAHLYNTKSFESATKQAMHHLAEQSYENTKNLAELAKLIDNAVQTIEVVLKGMTLLKEANDTLERDLNGKLQNLQK